MQVNLDTFKTTAFVLRKRLLGYKLLQNSKYTNPNDVTLVKSTLYIASGGKKYDCVDKNYHLSVINRFKKGGKYVKDKIFLMTTCFMDPKTRTYPHEEECYNGYSRKNGEAKYFDIPKVSDTNLKDRPSPDWECAFSGEPVEEFGFRGKLFKEHRENGPYIPDAKVFQNIPGFCLQLYNKVLDTDWHKLIRSNFWHVLKTNLNGGGVK